MKNKPSPISIKHFWDRYVKHLTKKGVKSTIIRWYVVRAEQYIKAFSDKSLMNHSPDESYFYNKRRNLYPRLGC